MAASLIAIGLRSTVSGKKSNLIFFVLKDPFTFFSKIECLANLAFAQCKNPPILPQSYKLRLKSITHTELRQCTRTLCVPEFHIRDMQAMYHAQLHAWPRAPGSCRRDMLWRRS